VSHTLLHCMSPLV